jgi:hypothetical protein
MQHGHRGSRLASATAMCFRSVDIELEVWRSGRSGVSARTIAFVRRRRSCDERLAEDA